MEEKIDFIVEYNKKGDVIWFDCQDLPGWYCAGNEIEEVTESLNDFLKKKYGSFLQKVEIFIDGYYSCNNYNYSHIG